jgi:hypothetical protein
MIGLFHSPLIFSLMDLGIHAELLKNQFCPSICIYFGFDPYSFDFYFF